MAANHIMLYLRRISGNSMDPTLRNGDYIVAAKSYFTHYQVADIVLVQHPQFGEIIKRIYQIDDNLQYWLCGDGTDTLSPQTMGAINRSDIKAKLLWHIKP